jgi:hypothetical protein
MSSNRSIRRSSSSNGVVNSKEIRVIGMSRSGSHAIINWILSQWPGRTCFLNCAEAGQSPFETCRPLDEGVSWRASFAEFDIEAERGGRFSRKDLLIYNHEDTFLKPLVRPEAETRRDEWVGASASRVDVLVLRDPFNLFASRLKKGCGSVSNETAMRIWKQHAREFLARSRVLKGHPLVLISYNRWACEQAYRRHTAEALDMPFTDAGFENVPAVAQGSSFDGLAFDGEASRMPVNDRWRHFAEDECYVELFDAQAIRLSRMAFGEVCRVKTVLTAAEPEPSVMGKRVAAVG